MPAEKTVALYVNNIKLDSCLDMSFTTFASVYLAENVYVPFSVTTL